MALSSDCSRSQDRILSPPLLPLPQSVQPVSRTWSPVGKRFREKQSLQVKTTSQAYYIEDRLEWGQRTEACGQRMPKPWASWEHLTWMFMPSSRRSPLFLSKLPHKTPPEKVEAGNCILTLPGRERLPADSNCDGASALPIAHPWYLLPQRL